MRKVQIGFSSVLVVALLFSSVGEAAWWSNYFDEEVGEDMQEQLMEQGDRMSSSRMRKMRGDYVEEESPREKQEDSRKRELRNRFKEKRESMDEEGDMSDYLKGMDGEEDEMYPARGERMDKMFLEVDMDFPDDWEEMTAEERNEFMEENEMDKPEFNKQLENKGEVRMGGMMNMKEGVANAWGMWNNGMNTLRNMKWRQSDEWDEMSPKERREYRMNNSEEGMEMRKEMELPDDWADITDDERKDFLEDLLEKLTIE